MKKRTLLLCLFAAVIFAIFMLPVKRTVDQTYPCNVLDQRDERYSDQVDVTIRGTYYDYLLRPDRFQGRIDLVDYELIPAEADDLKLEIGAFGRYGFDHMYYLNPGDALPEYPGTFHAAEDLDSFFLWLMVPNENGTGSSGRYFICWPEMTLDEVYDKLDYDSWDGDFSDILEKT